MSSRPSGVLVPIDQSNWRAAIQVRVDEEQLALVADYQPVALVILAKAYLQLGARTWEPLAYVTDGHSIAAVLALAHSEGVTEIVNLAVDVEQQGSGVGTELMSAVLAWSIERGSTSVELTVSPSNEIAGRMYQRAGLRPTGEMRDGEPIWRIVLN